MHWTKLGKIFDPTEYQLANGCHEFAQSPQALVFDHFVRIYFSTRQKDPANGKFLSHISFVDFKKDLKTVIQVARHTVIELGGLGCFDEHGIFPMNVIRNGNEIWGYTCGWNRKVSVSVDTSIGLAISANDGWTFTKMGAGPILTSSLHEPFLVGDPFVCQFGCQFHMWYIYGTNWQVFSEGTPPDRTYKIGHAISSDGVTWQKEGSQIIADKLDSFESQALPTLTCINQRYHMFFCYRQSYDFRKNRTRGYRIGYAWSDDLVSWTRDDENVGLDVSENEWDSDMLCYPHVFNCDGNVFILYNGNEFGRFGFGLAKLDE